jgi:hydroxylamine dehydrogenase
VVFSQQGATEPPYFDPDPEFEKTGLIHRNGCDSCHSRHRFDVAEARRPESCQTCHGRAANSLADAYLQSKHGSIYRSGGNNWDWKSRMPAALASGGYAAPTCATCHMLRAERYGDLTSTHKLSGKSVWGRGLQAVLALGDQATEAGYKASFQQLRQQSDGKRKAMILVCRNCHSEKFAADYLNAGDEVKLSSDLLVLRARAILEGLARDGLLSSTVAALTSRYQALGGVEKGAGELVPPPAIERAFLEMAFRENPRTRLAAFHQSPGDVLWEGFARLEKSLDQIEELEKQMREGAKNRRKPSNP